MSIFIKILAVIGSVFLVLLATGIALDIRDFDRTKGGYDPPYEGVTGDPIDWDSLDLTATGLVKRGYIVDTHVNGTTGMISFEIFKLNVDFRPLSERAIAVHNPREVFKRRGFEPEF